MFYNHRKLCIFPQYKPSPRHQQQHASHNQQQHSAATHPSINPFFPLCCVFTGTDDPFSPPCCVFTGTDDSAYWGGGACMGYPGGGRG